MRRDVKCEEESKRKTEKMRKEATWVRQVWKIMNRECSRRGTQTHRGRARGNRRGGGMFSHNQDVYTFVTAPIFF